MYILLIISFLMIALAAGYLLKTRLSDMLPFVWCGLILILYVLSFGRLLNLIDVIMPTTAVTLAFFLFRSKKKGFVSYAREELISLPFLAYVLLTIIILTGVWKKPVTWWDDINYWASDLKSLYYMNGFASKYANVSPEFGDYPPGVQLAKWFVVHADRHVFREGLAFAGYYLFNFSFLLPILGRIEEQLSDKKYKWIAIPAAVLMWLIPGIADKFGYAGFCADLSMAFLFGSILIAAMDVHEQNRKFDYARIMLYLSVLVLCKSTGGIWALFGIIYWIGVRIGLCRNRSLKSFVSLVMVAVAPFLTGLSWMGFCLIRHRVTKTTSTMVTYITTDKYGLSEYTGQFAKAFVKAFFLEPLHVDHTWIDPSPAAILALLIIALILLYKKNFLKPEQGRFVSIFLPVIGVVYYLVIFLAHITIFATETQYLESTAMIASIERYGVPFMLGSALLIAWIWFGGADIIELGLTQSPIFRFAVMVLAVLVLTNIPAAYNGLIGYRATLESEIAAREDIITEESSLFLSKLQEVFPKGNVRICRIHDGGYYRVADTYVAYEASPVSVMNISYDLNSVDAGTIIASVNQTHAVYLYADKRETDQSTCLDEMVRDGDFVYGQIYYVSYEDGGMVLYPVN